MLARMLTQKQQHGFAKTLQLVLHNPKCLTPKPRDACEPPTFGHQAGRRRAKLASRDASNRMGQMYGELRTRTEEGRALGAKDLHKGVDFSIEAQPLPRQCLQQLRTLGFPQIRHLLARFRLLRSYEECLCRRYAAQLVKRLLVKLPESASQR